MTEIQNSKYYRTPRYSFINTKFTIIMGTFYLTIILVYQLLTKLSNRYIRSLEQRRLRLKCIIFM